MKLLEIYEKLNLISPFDLQEKWDNSGLQIGSMDDEVQQIILSLDLDNELIQSAKENSLFITHHPLIFGKLESLDFDAYPANMIKKMMDKNLKLISLHTNFDKTHLNAYVATEVLGLKLENHENFLATAKVSMSFDDLVKKVTKDFGLFGCKVVKCQDDIASVSLCTGSGAPLLADVKTDVLLTGDIKYHDAMTAKSLNISMIDIGHYESEKFFPEVLAKELKDWQISVIISNSKNPFKYA